MLTTKPLNFGRRGMAAALNMSLEEFDQAYRYGEITARDKDALWSLAAMCTEITKRMPAGVDPLTHATEAVNRAERAEGRHDE